MDEAHLVTEWLVYLALIVNILRILNSSYFSIELFCTLYGDVVGAL